MAALRESYVALTLGESAYAPRIDLLGPVEPPMGAYRWGSMSGICLRSGVVAVRVKSDVVGWGDDGVERKYCVRPGLYSGIVIVYDIANGRPLALLQDGIVQHVRLGAAIGLGAAALLQTNDDGASAEEHPSTPDAGIRVGFVGSGGMAWSTLSALVTAIPVAHVSVYSPTPANRDAFARRAGEELGVPSAAVASAREAVAGAQLVVSATSSTSATLAVDWLEDDAVVAFVSRREVPQGLHDDIPEVYRFGEASLGADTTYPGLEWYRGGYAGIAVGDAAFRATLPRRRPGEGDRSERDLPRLLAGDVKTGPGRKALVAVGTQGLQFASVAGLVARTAEQQDVGTVLPDDWFLQDIRD